MYHVFHERRLCANMSLVWSGRCASSLCTTLHRTDRRPIERRQRQLETRPCCSLLLPSQPMRYLHLFSSFFNVNICTLLRLHDSVPSLRKQDFFWGPFSFWCSESKQTLLGGTLTSYHETVPGQSRDIKQSTDSPPHIGNLCTY